MTINNIPGPFRAANTITPPKVKASEEGLFKPITVKVSEALSDKYIEQIKAQARTDAAQQAAAPAASGYSSASLDIKA